MVGSILCDMRKDSFNDTFFEMNKFPKKEPMNFCKFFDNEGTFQQLLNALVVRSFCQSNRLISLHQSKFYDQYYGDDNLSQGHLMVVSVPCDIRNEQTVKERIKLI